MPLTIAGKYVGDIGFGMIGLMRLPSPEDAFPVMKAALNAGANYWDAGELYGTPEYNSLHLLNKYFSKYPEDASKVFISVKGCFDMSSRRALNDKEGVKASIENCLKILDGKCQIDLFQAARGDPDVPIETTVSAIADYVAAGKVGTIGLSECSAATIRRATIVHAISAVEVELSLIETGIFANGVAGTCAEFGIPIIAYSPLCRGLLTGKLRKYEDLGEHDYRKVFPRFQPDAFKENVKLVGELESIAKEKGCTVSQVAIAWVSEQTETADVPVIPIPGASAVERVEQNLKKVVLTGLELNQINQALSTFKVKGDRYPAALARFVEV